MKTLLENKIFIRMLLCGVISSLAVLSGCATVKQVSVTTPIKIKGKKEILVAEDIGRGSGVSRVFWCGNDALVAYSDKTGMELIEVQGGKRIEVSRNGQDYPFNCSPDGRWVLYMDRASTRLDKGEAMPLVYDGKPFEFDPKLDVWPVWE
ncbi:MAG: hypothetical protein GWN13_27935, partial [Phycisphaerae bacterium]|nr:hypothetical protein [Phycisphaerae bacterium]